MNATEELLRGLAANDERCLRGVFGRERRDTATLNRETRALVQLSALIAVGAGTASLRWAVELAAGTGAGDEALVQVLLTCASAAGAARRVEAAPRLALALDFDVDVDGWDGT